MQGLLSRSRPTRRGRMLIRMIIDEFDRNTSSPKDPAPAATLARHEIRPPKSATIPRIGTGIPTHRAAFAELTRNCVAIIKCRVWRALSPALRPVVKQRTARPYLCAAAHSSLCSKLPLSENCAA